MSKTIEKFSVGQVRWVAYAMAAALFAVIATAFTALTWGRGLDQHDRVLRTMVGVGAQAVDIYLGTLEKALGQLGKRVQDDGAQVINESLLKEFKAGFPEFQIVAIGLPDGTPIATSEGLQFGQAIRSGAGLDPSLADAVDKLRKGAGMVVSRPFFGRLSHTWLTMLRYGVRDASGQLQYVIAAGLPQAKINLFWASANLPPDAGVSLIRDDDYIVARYPVPSEREATIFSEPTKGLIAEHLKANGHPQAGLFRGDGVTTGARTTFAYQRLANQPLTFFALNPERNLFWAWWSLAWPGYLLLALLFGGGVVIIHWISGRLDAWQVERNLHLADLEKANAELTAFNYTLSHDLRGPIRAIDGYASLIADELKALPDSEGRTLLGKIRENAKRMWTLMDDLIAVSRDTTQAMPKVVVNTGAMVRSIVEDHQFDSAGTRFEIGELPPSQGDPILLRQVWNNLIANAVKFSAKADGPRVQVGFANGAYFVSDNGAGFDMAYADKLFKIFSRLHAERDYPGNGVGLVIVKRIVEWHGGRIWAEGENGKGARFLFTLA